MICLSSQVEREEIAKRLLECRAFIETLARSAGHDDPPDFFGQFALEVLSKRERLPLDMAKQTYFGWLARLRLRDYYRRRAARPRSYSLGDHELEDCHACGLGNPTGTPVQPCRARNAVSALSERSHEILVRKFLLRESDAEVALKIGLSKSGVRSSVYRSKQLLKQLLYGTNDSI